MYYYCRPTVRSGWVGEGVTDEKGGPGKGGGPLNTPMIKLFNKRKQISLNFSQCQYWKIGV